jgi:hypothetical protein
MTMVAILLGGEYLQWVLRKHIISIFSRSNASYEVTFQTPTLRSAAIKSLLVINSVFILI